MKTAVLCNVGNRDLARVGEDGTAIFAQRSRSEGQQWFEAYEQYNFRLPIIESYLTYLLEEGIEISCFILFDTDQQDMPGSNELDFKGVPNKEKDTLWFGAIIARYLQEQYPQIQAVQQVTIEQVNPSVYDTAFDVFKDQLKRLNLQDFDRYYVLTSGGTPAFNNALLLRGISLFGPKFQALYKTSQDFVYEMQVGEQIVDTFNRMTVINLLSKGDFSGAYQIFSTLNHVPAPLVALLRYARDRQAFDFEGARVALRAAEKDTGALRVFAFGLRSDLQKLLSNNTEVLLKELYSNAVTTFEMGRYVDFLGRLFRFREAVSRYLVEQIYAINTDYSSKNKAANQQNFLDFVDANSGLKEHLDSARIKDKPLKYQDDLSSQVLLRLVDYAVNNGVNAEGQPFLSIKIQAGYQTVIKKLNAFEHLSTLRNQSIVAHGYQGVSLEKIEAAYKGNLLEDLKSVMGILRLSEKQHTLDDVRDFLIDRIRQL